MLEHGAAAGAGGGTDAPARMRTLGVAGPRAVTRTGHVCGAEAAVCAAGLLAVKENYDLEFGFEHCASVRAISMNISAC